MCTCEPGYILVDGICEGIAKLHNRGKLSFFGIVDIDECSGLNDCQQNCINTEGSFECSCDEAFTLDMDGRTCSRKS